MKIQIAVIATTILFNAGQILALEGTRRLGKGKSPPGKVTICHLKDDGAYIEITLSSKAWTEEKELAKEEHLDCKVRDGMVCDSRLGCVYPPYS